uniref:acetylcholinesterase n=1 Tax=Plectus sambesii TaxID=2011161 RepID=A0A914VXY6_9BILA
MRSSFCDFVALLALCFGLGSGEGTLKHLKNGKIRGIIQMVDDQPVYAYLGVPYGEMPTGDRRFAPPQPKKPWVGELAADKPATACYFTKDNAFPNFPGAEMWNAQNESEDCLNMNIWVPEESDGTVMVWVYGGGYFSGSPSLDLYDGRMLAASMNVIVVNINYRLGPFGFLYFGHGSSAAGNMGLQDQQLALRWIKENIHHFEGNEKKITLFGESAGAASISAHLFAPGSKNLFSRIILQSGSILNQWATSNPNEMLRRSRSLATRLNCSIDLTQEEIVNCIRGKPAIAVQHAAEAITNTEMLPLQFAFVPIDEDYRFFYGNLHRKLRQLDFNKDIDVIVGTNKDEGSYWLPYYLDESGFHFDHRIPAEDPANRALISRSQFERSLNHFSAYFRNSSLVRHALLHEYGDTAASVSDLSKRLRDGISAFTGDFFFTCDVIRLGDLLAENVNEKRNVYMYYFTQRSSANPWPKWMGIMHGYEIEYVFGMPLRRPKVYDSTTLGAEQRFSENIMKLWFDFANTGNPASTWPPYKTSTKLAYVLDSVVPVTGHRLESHVRRDRCRLLQEVAKYVDEDCKTTSNSGNVPLPISWIWLLPVLVYLIRRV